MKTLSSAMFSIGIALFLIGCASPRVAVPSHRAEQDFLRTCHDLAHSNALVRCANRYPGSFTNTLSQSVRPILQPDEGLVRSAERLFLHVYTSIPSDQKADVAPQLVTFGTTGTWATAKSELSYATYAVREAIVGELLNQLANGVTGRVERVEQPSPMEYALGFGWRDERPVDSEWSIEEIPAVLADLLMKDTEILTFEILDRNPFLPFISTRGIYSTTISGSIARDILAFGVTSPEIETALEKIRTSADHPTRELLISDRIAEPSGSGSGSPAAGSPSPHR